MAYTNAHFRVLLRELERFAAEELDQWVAWRVESLHGPVYVQMGRGVPPGREESAYDRVSSDMPLRED